VHGARLEAEGASLGLAVVFVSSVAVHRRVFLVV
jgi:hypothetical protein